MQDWWEVETRLRDNFTAFNNLEADKAVFNIKSNPKLFFGFAKLRQKTRARDGPFIDPTTIKQNPSSLFKESFFSDRRSWGTSGHRLH